MWCSAVYNPFKDLQSGIKNIEAGVDTKWAVDEEGTYATFCIWNADNNMLQLRLTLEECDNNPWRAADTCYDFLLDKDIFLKQLRHVEDYLLNNGHWTAKNPIDYF